MQEEWICQPPRRGQVESHHFTTQFLSSPSDKTNRIASQIDAKLPTKISIKVLPDFHSLADSYQRILPHYLIFMSDVTYIGGFFEGKWE